MAIVVNIDVMMARRKMSLNELSEKVDITPANLSILKKRESKGNSFFYLGSDMSRIKLSAGRYFRIYTRNKRGNRPFIIL